MTDNTKTQIKNLIEKLLIHSIPTAIIAFVVSAVFLVACIFKFDHLPTVKYVSYSLTFYTLSVLVIAIVREGVPWFLYLGRQLPIIGNAIINIRYRQRLFLYTGGMVNTLYLVFYLWVAYYYKSRWFYVIGLYNLSIAIMKAYLSRQEHNLQLMTDKGQRAFKEGLVVRDVALMLFIMNNVISVMGLLIIFKDETFKYNFIILYGIALYVFIRLGVIITGIIRRKEHNNGIWKAVQLMNLATAMVSMFTFQTALLHNYEPSAASRERFNGMTGALVLLVNQSIVVILLIYSRKLKKHAYD